MFYSLYSNLKSSFFMQCNGIILKITTDSHLVLIFLCQVRPFVTWRSVKENNGRPVQRIYGTGTIRWQNSASDRRKFYIKFQVSTISLSKVMTFFMWRGDDSYPRSDRVKQTKKEKWMVDGFWKVSLLLLLSINTHKYLWLT